MKSEMYRALDGCLADDHSRQVAPEYYVELLLRPNHDIRSVLDLGCGTGDSVGYFRKRDRSIVWIGLDLKKSPEVDLRTRTDAHFVCFDGVHVPFADAAFDLVYFRQVLEHVRYPFDLLKEVHRVLRPGGYLVGSTSHLEPYHSYSLQNFTPYGFRVLLEEAGLRLLELRPGIDALTLIARRALGRPEFFSRWFKKESPINLAIGLLGKFIRIRPALRNLLKLLFCGQFCFLAGKTDATLLGDE